MSSPNWNKPDPDQPSEPPVGEGGHEAPQYQPPTPPQQPGAYQPPTQPPYQAAGGYQPPVPPQPGAYQPPSVPPYQAGSYQPPVPPQPGAYQPGAYQPPAQPPYQAGGYQPPAQPQDSKQPYGQVPAPGMPSQAQQPYPGSPYQAQQPYPGSPYLPVPAAGQLADWPLRAFGGLIDYVVPGIVLSLLSMPFAPNPNTGLGGNSLLYSLFGTILPIVWWVYNSGYKQGTTGQTFGKQVAKTRLVGEATGQPIGFGLAVVRQVLHFLDGICLVGFLFPLWDPKRQTFADKIMKTVVVRDA